MERRVGFGEFRFDTPSRFSGTAGSFIGHSISLISDPSYVLQPSMEILDSSMRFPLAAGSSQLKIDFSRAVCLGALAYILLFLLQQGAESAAV